MSYHIYPVAGRESFLRSRPRYPPQMLKSLNQPTTGTPFTTTINSGWNDPVLLPVSKVEGHAEPTWSSPTVNVLPTDSPRPLSISSRPFGSIAPSKTVLPAMPMLPRTPLQSMSARSEHWFSDPIHGVFTDSVSERNDRWTTSNRNVFRQRDGVHNSQMSASIMARVASASNGSISPSEHSKTYLSRSQHCWERVNTPRL